MRLRVVHSHPAGRANQGSWGMRPSDLFQISEWPFEETASYGHGIGNIFRQLEETGDSFTGMIQNGTAAAQVPFRNSLTPTSRTAADPTAFGPHSTTPSFHPAQTTA